MMACVSPRVLAVPFAHVVHILVLLIVRSNAASIASRFWHCFPVPSVGFFFSVHYLSLFSAIGYP
jgi:hypothetical protein